MKRLDRRKFMLLASAGSTGAVLTACGNDPDSVNLNPTMIPDVAGAPPTLAPNATPGGGASAPEEEPAADEGGGEASIITIEAQDPYVWSLTEFEAAPGQIIQATNVGFLPHNFAVDEWGIEVDLPAGEPIDILVPDDVAVGDTYVYYCSITGHREGGMEGTLTIVEAEAAAPAGESAEASPEVVEAEAAAAEAAPAEGGGAAGGEPIMLEAQDPYAWSVTELEAAPGQVIQATNVGFLPHNFAVDEWGIEVDLPAGEPIDITVPDDVAVGDTYVYYCSITGHREGGMEGTLTIV